MTYSSIASSADGTKLVAVNGEIYSSRDSGASWSRVVAPASWWNGVACSADGNKVLAVCGAAYIYPSSLTEITLQFPIQLPQPPLASRWLNISSSGGGANVSWLVPSSRSVLQENPDLTSTNWTDVPTVPSLNFTDLHYEVKFQSSPGSHFYRLKQQQ